MVETLASRVLGRHLRALRVRAGLTGSYVAAAMECSPAKISRQEHGTHAITVTELSHLVTQLYRREDQEEGECRKILVELEALRQRSAHGRGWWMENAGDMPWHERAYLEIEDEAERIDTFSSDVIPGLLQTADYARMQERVFGVSNAEHVERTAWLRTQRQVRIYDSSNPPALDVVLCEGSLRRCVGSGQFEQLGKLVERSELPNVTIRVIPDSMGIHGITAHYTVLSLPNVILGPVMHLEYLGGSIIVEEEQAVARTLDKHRSLDALDPDESRDFLKDFITQNRSGQLGTAVA